jgi:hypothetical protein
VNFRFLPRINWKKDLVVFGVFLAVVVWWQSRDGAYKSEFGGHPDEAAHYVTGLMVRDYLASGFHTPPMAYARDYYDHYPKVALGNWPPVFYLMQAAWTLPFGVDSDSIMLFMATLAALLAWVLYRVLATSFGEGWSALWTIAFLWLPLVRQHYGMVMTEIPVALFAFLAVIFFGRFLDGEDKMDSAAFGVLAGIAIMTKGSALALAFVPPLAICLTRKFHLLKRPSLWSSALIVAVIAGPWTIKFRETAKAGWMEESPSWHFTREAIQYYPKKLVISAGVGLLLFAIVGAVLKLRQGRTAPQPSGRWAAFIAAVIGVVALQSLVPAGYEPRHLVQALPPLICLSVAGFELTFRWMEGRFPFATARLPACVIFLAIASEPHLYQRSSKSCSGFRPLAGQILRDPANASSVLFVSSDARGEGQFISEVAMREKRPGHVVQRASKVLASSTWGGDKYQAKAGDAAQIFELLESKKIRIVVVDESIPDYRRQPHHKLLQKTVDTYPKRFQLLARSLSERDGVARNDIKVYRLVP